MVEEILRAGTIQCSQNPTFYIRFPLPVRDVRNRKWKFRRSAQDLPPLPPCYAKMTIDNWKCHLEALFTLYAILQENILYFCIFCTSSQICADSSGLKSLRFFQEKYSFSPKFARISAETSPKSLIYRNPSDAAGFFHLFANSLRN